MKIPLQSSPQDEHAIDQWLSPKITTTSREIEERFDSAARDLAVFRKPKPHSQRANQPVRWRSIFYALGTMAAALVGSFIAVQNSTHTSAQTEVPELAAMESLFELDTQLSAAVALLDAETFDALVYISHENHLR